MAIIDDFAAIRDAMPEGDMSCEELAATNFEAVPAELSDRLCAMDTHKRLADACKFAGMILALPKSALTDLVGEMMMADGPEGLKETLLALEEERNFCECLPELFMKALSHVMVAGSAWAMAFAAQNNS